MTSTVPARPWLTSLRVVWSAGRCDVFGVEVGDREDEEFWTAFLAVAPEGSPRAARDLRSTPDPTSSPARRSRARADAKIWSGADAGRLAASRWQTVAVEAPAVNFVDVDGVAVAWQQYGSGPDVLVVPAMLSNMELAWEHKYFRRFFEYMARHVRVTAFDKRGVGLSDKIRDVPTLEQRTDDILAVMDAAGLDRPALMGASEGGLIAQLFTALHPERVARLVLKNSLPGTEGSLAIYQDPDGSWERLERFFARMERVLDTWGRDAQYFVDWFCPSRSDDAAFVRWWGRYQRMSATSADMRRQSQSLVLLDAGPRLGEIAAPTLILQTVDDPVVPVAAAHYLAERIPDARLVEMPGKDHFLTMSPHWQESIDLSLQFVTGSRPTRLAERRVVTVLFTDIVGSTARAAALGDHGWRGMLEDHDRIARALADRHLATIVKSTGDGLLAHFDAPSQALGYAVDLRRALTELDLRIRCGVHTGEVELRDGGDISGTAVNLAARVEQAAGDGDILVSSTVRDIMLGSDVRFADAGEHLLKGFEGQWRLFVVAE